jgi:hypothetical protein
VDIGTVSTVMSGTLSAQPIAQSTSRDRDDGNTDEPFKSKSKTEAR